MVLLQLCQDVFSVLCCLLWCGCDTQTSPCLREKHPSPLLREDYVFQNPQVMPGPHTCPWD